MIFSGFVGRNSYFAYFSTINSSLKPVTCSEKRINLFQAVKFQRLRILGGYFVFPNKFQFDFDNFVVLPTITAKINIFYKKYEYTKPYLAFLGFQLS